MADGGLLSKKQKANTNFILPQKYLSTTFNLMCNINLPNTHASAIKVLFLHYHLIGWASQSVEPCTVVSKIRGYLEWQMGASLQKGKSECQFHNASKRIYLLLILRATTTCRIHRRLQ